MENIGDNANHNGLRSNLKKYLYPNIKYTQIEIREFYKSWGIRDFNDSGFIALCNQHDLIIIGGGNFFELKWDYSHTGTTIDISEKSLEKIRTPILFFGLGCDIAKGTNENNKSKFYEFLNYIVSVSRYMVTVRNDGSYETINKLYGNTFDNKIIKVSDGGFFLNTGNYAYHEINNKYNKLIGINIVSDMKEIRFSEGLSYEEFLQDLAKVINEYLDKNSNYQIIFFPHIFSDLEAISKVMNFVKDIYRRTKIIVAPLLSGEGSEEYIFGLYRKCDVILGMRFHSNVCSIAQNIPTIALSSYKKIDDLYAELNLMDRVVQVNKQGIHDEILRKLENTVENLEQVKNTYKIINKKLEKESCDFYLKLKEWAILNRII